jgi:hypothetical protein
MGILKINQQISDTNDNLNNQHCQLFLHKIVPGCGKAAKSFCPSPQHSIAKLIYNYIPHNSSRVLVIF